MAVGLFRTKTFGWFQNIYYYYYYFIFFFKYVCLQCVNVKISDWNAYAIVGKSFISSWPAESIFIYWLVNYSFRVYEKN